MKERGYLYFLTNQCMPGLLKIGFTKGELDVRVRQLRSSGVPAAFAIAAAFLVENPEECEKEIHKVLDSARITRDREFFKVQERERGTFVKY
ncbi:MAG: GIY-YIG nuclease family protein [Desulfobacterales bacterium]|nr:GIY-YIG nuclease family protein [Desulfobacterales bacterium]